MTSTPTPPAIATDQSQQSTSAVTAPCTLQEFLLYFLRLGALGFGGPIALAGYMQRDLVESRRWIAKQDYVEGLALAQLAPGPLAAQPAIYLGWVRAGSLGATLVSAAFILPSFLMVLMLSVLYGRYGGLSWMQGVFYSIGAAVIAIIARSAYKLVGSLSKAFFDGVTAAATGAIAGAAFVLGKRAIIDVPTVLLALATFGVLSTVGKAPEPLVMLSAGAVGLLLQWG